VPDKINGLPAHILLVHAVVVLVPLAALLAVIAIAWPAARRKLGVIVPLCALAGLAFVPLATEAGEWLEEHVKENALVEKHTSLGDGLLPWALLLFVLATLYWLLDFAPARNWRVPAFATSAAARVVVSVALAAVAVVSVVQVYRIGDSGAKAAWHDQYSSSATGHDGG
jgi:hypothetical protein